MPYDENYRRQVQLLVRALPHVARETCFALKGGTAINLFIRDLPRLSVDIDLAYLPVAPRAKSLEAIKAALLRIAEALRKAMPGAHVKESQTGDGSVTKLVLQVDRVQIKVEVTPVLRGCVFEPEQRDVSPSVEDEFGFASMPVVSFADLYGGKIVAALDRQHPRDLFDVRDLLANEGIDHALRQAFIVYLISHTRPMSEVLEPTRKDIKHEYRSGFVGMSAEPVSLEQLVETREQLIAEITGNMPDEHRRFLIGFEEGKPDWSLLGVPGAAELPAVLWRQLNLDKLSASKREQLVNRLREVLGG